MTATSPRLLILGPQGVGKGTQAELLAPALGVVHVSSGALLRRAVQERSVIGRCVERSLANGDLVADEVILQLVGAELDRVGHDAGCILDGFPRTVSQAVALADLLGEPVDAAIELTLPLGVLLERLTRRRLCPGCGVATAAPAGYIDAVACPNGDGIATRRDDDVPATIAHRLALYDRHTEPLVAYLRGGGNLLTIDDDGEPAAVHATIMRGLSAQLGRRWDRVVATAAFEGASA